MRNSKGQASGRVFLSYQGEDREFAYKMKIALRGRKFRAYPYDLLGTLGAEGIFDPHLLYEKLQRPNAAVVVLSSNYFEDPWFYQELPALFSMEVRLGSRIILPVLIDDVIDKIPLYLQEREYIDFRSVPFEDGFDRTIELLTKSYIYRSEKIFLVHGRDDAAKETVARFIERLGFDVVILHEQPNSGKTIIEKLERNVEDVGFALVLLTPDDIGASHGEADKPQPRARQNVIFELGLFVGILGRHRVCALHKGALELPSDYQGVLYIPMDEQGGWRTQIVKELEAAGFILSRRVTP
jgi:hypothetical protein